MAEVVGLTASLIGIASLGVKLTRTLYDFGATTSHAREEIDYISNNVSDYADVLELLVEQLEHDRPMHSKKAIRLAERLYDRSHHLFDRIRDLIPDGRRIRDHVSFLQRISWNFKKTRVAHLVGELESLKRTVQLLVQVLCTARQFQAYKDHVGKAEDRQKKQETAHRQFLRAENVIVEWQRANEKLPSLREASEHEDQLQIQAGSAPPEAKEPLPSEEARSLVKVQGNTLAVIETATVDIGRSESEKRALVLQRTASWLEQLLDEWTVLAQEQETGRPSGERSLNEKAFKPSSVPAAKAGGIDETTGRPKPLSSDRASTQYVTGGVENISGNIGRSTSHRKSSVEQGRGEYTPPGSQDSFQQPTNSHGRSQRAKVDHLRRNMNDLVSAYLDAGLHNLLQYRMLEEQIMSNVILKADELQLSEPEARLNRKELIVQAERYLSRLDPRLREMPSSKSRKGDAVPARGSNLKHMEIHDSGYGSSGEQTPDLSGTSPPRYGPTEPARYQIVEDEDDVSTILVDPEDRHRRTTSSWGGDRRDRPQRPTISTDSRPRSSRGAAYQHSPIEVEPRSTSYRQDSARSTQPRGSPPRESPSGSRQMDRNEPYTLPYPNVKTSPCVNEKDIKYNRHARRPLIDESDRERNQDYFPYSYLG